MHRRREQQRRDRRLALVAVAVGEDHDVGAVGDGRADLGPNALDRVAQAVAAPLHLEQALDRDRLEAQLGRVLVDVAQLGQLVVVDHRVRHDDLVARPGGGLEQVALGTDRRRQARDQRLEVRVERWVRHLREELLEVVVELAGQVREHRQRGVGAHRPERLDRVLRHRRHDDPQVLLRVAEHSLLVHRGGVHRHERVLVRQVVEPYEPAIEPLLVRVLGRERGLDLVVGDHAALRGVHEEHLAGLEAALAHHLVRRHVEHADLAGHDHEVVVGDPVAARAQPVAVEHRADHRAVGERDRRRTVPRLHQRRVVLVERAPLRIHRLVVLPGLRDHHQHRVVQRPAREVQQLEGLVEAGGVARTRCADGKHPLEVAGDDVARHPALARLHPVLVALHGVDLAVVRDHPVGMRERPARERVRGETRVQEHERALDALVGEVEVELRHLPAREHALVDHGAARETREVDAELVLDPLARRPQMALELHAAYTPAR